MSSINHHNSFLEAYKEGILDIIHKGKFVKGVNDPNSIGSNFGKKVRNTRELISYTFVVKNPRSRTFRSNIRKLNRPFLLANFLWILNGSKSASKIIDYNKKGEAFLDPKGDLNSAIGPHLFKIEKGLYFEFEFLTDLLKKDPTTRRAVLQLYSKKDLRSNSRDIPCYNHLQFFVREDKLHCAVNMRSQSAFMVLPYDFFLFSLLHEAMSIRIGIDLGYIYHTSNSFHIYEDELEKAEAFLSSDYIEEYDDSMENFENETINQLKLAFEIISNTKKRKVPSDNICARFFQTDVYWNKMINKYILQ